MKFDRGFISPYFATDPKTQVFDVEDALVLLVEKKVSSIQSIVPLLETVVKAQRPLLVVAEDVESEALATLDHLGSCKRCTVSKDDAIVLDGGGARADVEARCDAIRDLIAASTSDYEREKLQERLAKLGGGVAVIKVGGASEVEVSEKKDRVVDALNATRAAVEAGVVPGGGRALLHASTKLEGVVDALANLDQRVGAEIVQRALRAPWWSASSSRNATRRAATTRPPARTSTYMM